VNLTFKRKTINEVSLGLFILISVIVPGDIFNIKKILFLFIFLFNGKLLINSIFSKKNRLYSFYGLVFPTFLFVYSSVMTQDIFISFERSYAAYILLMVFIIKKYEINYEKMLVRVISCIVFLTLLLALLDLMNLIDINTGFFRNEIMYKYDLGLMGKSIEYPMYYKIYFKTSSLIVILLFKKFEQGKYVYVFFALASLVFSGTRANVLFPIFFLILFYVFYSKGKSKIIKCFFVLLCISLAIVFSSNILNMLNEYFVVKGKASDIVRMGHIEGLKDLILNNPLIIITGSGMGSDFYSYGTDTYVSSIEWSYIDLWRQMGFLPFLLFIIFLVTPLFKNNVAGNYKKFAFLSYLCIAATNPLLFSSTSYLFFIYMYYDLKDINNVHKKRMLSYEKKGKHLVGNL
jgi:hypothetical protein